MRSWVDCPPPARNAANGFHRCGSQKPAQGYRAHAGPGALTGMPLVLIHTAIVCWTFRRRVEIGPQSY
jgi:hypothetical protein